MFSQTDICIGSTKAIFDALANKLSYFVFMFTCFQPVGPEGNSGDVQAILFTPGSNLEPNVTFLDTFSLAITPNTHPHLKNHRFAPAYEITLYFEQAFNANAFFFQQE